MDDKIILNPQMYAPMGYSIWIASDHKIEVIPKSLAWTEEKEYFQKAEKKYEIEAVNMAKDNYFLVFKYDFNVTEENTEIQFSLQNPSDKYLLRFFRLKLVDKSCSESDQPLSLKLSETLNVTTINACQTKTLVYQPNKNAGYSIICESIPPYDVNELTLNLVTYSNKEEFELTEVEQVPPLTYSSLQELDGKVDTYVPYKYSQIFKEKIFVGDHTSASFHIQMTQKI